MASNSPSVSTSPSTQGWTYDVFLSFRGPDTRKTFIDFLYESLERRGIRTFKDDDRLEKGDCISTSLIKAIQESQFLIAVFSEGYASSKWCLEELATMMECHETFKKQIVVPIFHNVEPSDVRKQEGSFGDSFKELVERFVKDEEEEKVRRWKEALKNAGYLKGHHLQNDYKGYEATCAEKVAADIDARLNRASLAFEENLVGLESRVNNIGNWLRLATDDNDDFRFIGICGMGGIGKTTIATCVFNKFSYQFDGACFLVDIRQHNVIELQKTLLTKILKERSEVIEINNAQDGIGKIKRRLKEKKVLIVLDDVDNKLEQLDKLAGGGDWFGRGSRVIITTRDAGVLRSHGVDEKYIYPVHTLRVEEGIQLFISYAFKKKPKIGVEQLCGLVVRYCKGLPLALKILGSSLCGLEAADWESTLEELKDTPNDDIDVKLKISFDRLDSKNKKIFLHIACYFRHQKEEHVKEALKSCNLLPAMGLRVLVEKSLISVEEGNIEMHDLIQEMGWRIARDEKHSSRVWEFKEVDDVLCGKMDPKHIEFMLFPYTCGFRWQNISNTFEALKILIGKRSRSYDEEGDNNYQLPSSLRWLHFPDYPFSSLPTSFHPSSMDMNPSELVGLCLHRSSLENCWITKELNKLTYLDLSSSGSLLKTPKFDMMPNLRSLDLSHCSKLKEIHPSVGRLEKLVLLDLSLCWQLQTLPCFVQVSSLRILKLESCSELENFPEIQANMPLVLELNLDRIGIRELPSSIGRLRGLTELGLCGCNDLVSLSDDLCELENLKILELRDCPELESLPEKLGNLSKLEELHIIETAIFQLPSSIAQLSSLECLCWGSNEEFDDERGLKFLPSVSGLRSLKKLQLSHFRITDEGLPSDLGQCLISLEYLNLEGSKFDYLPESFGQLPHLQYLDLRDCEELEMLPELPKTIRELYMHSHFVSGNKSINIAMFAIKYPKLYSISFSSCGDAYDRFRGETFLVKETIQFPFHRKTPFSVSYSSKEFEEPMNDRYPFLRSFQYQRFKSNRICFDLNPYWYSTQFGGFAVYFVSYHDDMWEPHSYEGFDRHTRHCVFKAKLSSHNDIHEDLKIKCVIAGSTCYNDRAICFVYVPFSSLWPESKPITEASDYSRFEVELVNLKASADWGINLLYKSRYTFPSLEGAREHMGNYHRSDSEQSNEEAPLFEETPVLSTQPEPVVRNQTKSLAKLFKRHEEENTKANVEMWKEELKKDGEISGYHLRNDFNGFKAKCVEIVTHDGFSHLLHYTILKDNFVGLETRVGYVVEDGIIKMHHLIQEMGWRIARDEKHKSRVWEFKEVDDVLCGKMDSKHIESIVFPYTCGFRWQNISNAFKVLKILIGKRSLAYNKEEDTHSNAFEVLTMNNYQFPSSLELIHFPDYPFPLLPTSLHHPSGMDDNPLELAVISSHRCSLGNCRITEKLNKLTYLNLSSSCSLLETPNFDMMPNLEKLYLSCCEKLVEIHPSVGYLKKLVLLDLSYCCNLRRLPRFIQVSSLQFLKLECCQELRKFPEIQENMPLVLELNLRGIRIRELPSSIGRLRGLTMLCLCQCEYLVSLSDDLCELESLKILELRDCDELESLPENLGNLSKLKELHIIDTAIFQLPSSITQLSSLECLCWGGSSALGKFKKEISLKFLPSLSSLRSLKKLRLSGFKIIDKGLPSDLGQCLISLEYLNLVGSNFDYLLESFSRLPHLQYLDITYCEKLPQQLPATIRELYATSNLASESNMAKLAIKYPKLYSVSFSLEHVGEEITFSAVGLARKFAHAPFQIMRNSSFIVTYPIQYCSTDRDMTEWFKYSSYHSNKISVSLKSSWFNQSFVGFVVCFILKPGDSSIWKLCPDGFPFRYGEVIAQLVHKDNEQLLQTNCVIGRQDHECNEFMDTEIICFAYIPFHSLFNNELSATPSDYLVFEVGFGDAASNALTDWSCGLLYQNDESLSEAIWSKTSSHHNGDSVPNGANLWEFTKVVNQVQCQMVSMPECSDTKVVRLLYTNSGGGILALSSNGIQELWKWPNNEQNPTGKRWTLSRCPPCTCSRVGPDDVVDVNLEKVAPCIDLYKNDSYIVSAVGRKVSFFNTMTFEVMTTFRPYATPTFLVVYPYNNNVIAIGTENGTIILYNVRVDEVKVQLFKGWCKRITGLAFSTTDPSILVSSSADAKLCVWDIGCGWCDIRSSVRIRSSGDTHVMFHTDQLHLLVTHETQLAIYHISNMKRKRQWIPQGCLPAPISSATYSCNSQLVYASFIDGNIGEFEANNLTLRCRIAPSAYLSQPVLNSEGVVYAVVIAAHPQEPNQLAIGLTDGSIKVIEPLKSEGEWGISPLIDIEIQNGKEGEDEGRGESLDGDEVVEEYEANESNAGHGVEVAMSEHNDSEHGAAEAAMAEHSAKSPIETSVCKTVFEAPKVQTTEKRKAHTQSSVAFYKRKEGDIFIISDQQVNEEDDDEEEGGEEEDKQRKKARLDNNDKVPEDIIINSGKQNKGKNEQNDGRGELLAANVQPLFVDDDVFQCLGNDCKKLYDLLREGTMEYNMDCIGVELDANIFHHTNVERIFVVIKDIKDLFTMNWLDVSVIQVFIMYLYQLCKEFEVSSIGFMCPTQIAKDNVDRNSKVVMAYLRNTMSKLQDKTFILAPYHQVNHWLLLVICTSARMVYVLDPMQCDRDLEIKPVLNMAFRTFTNQQGQRARWKNIKCPRQPGNSECGYYVMRYMYDICKKYFANTLLDEAFQETEAYSDKEIDEICNMWAKYFLNECV
ncbi:uncharacterized protein LOC116025601 isoform X10 [Ipomoea triloba]|uniref:uncharacterized protein LOC116025601 isoform X10 n=1 Tax=Ipomoea triloba TaxID=35885 RepID=UPI00125DD886|nr:uncharacterized protein LOC116025601 isoform X10 [Ipomoea triloba]